MRRAKPEKREILPDIRYNSVHVQTMVQHVLKRGKKSVATGLIYDAMDLIKDRTDKNPLEVFEIGENEIHCHLDEDHSFIVLEGQMSVFDELGNEIKVEKYQGVMIPKGAYYRYHNTGPENLVVIRVGAGIKGKPQGGEDMRIRPDGKPLPGYEAQK